MDRIFRTSGLMRPKWDRKQAGSTYGAISIRNTVNTCASVYIPVNAQDIVDEEFANLDSDDKEAERPPDISKLTLSLEEMAPHTNPRYGRDEIGLGNMFADFFNPILFILFSFIYYLLFTSNNSNKRKNIDLNTPEKCVKSIFLGTGHLAL